ncbi:MAG: hypothetical protein MZV49_08235 [Rhodopseudomonas palustris]|nr:hypothetical protein [Rhodopseudomonas palustris]
MTDIARSAQFTTLLAALRRAFVGEARPRGRGRRRTAPRRKADRRRRTCSPARCARHRIR